MKNLLLFAVLLCSTVSFSQLYVSPNGTDDSYIYVKDEVIFVEQDVNLVENNAGTTEASIYLRDQAQLIQGATVSSNKGTGYISVIQDSNSDAYDYNFWGSPVGDMTLGGGSDGNKSFGMLRVYDSLTLTNSTVNIPKNGHNGTSSPLRISSRWTYKYGAGGPFVNIGTSSNVAPGYGFIMKGTDVTAAGVPETQNQKYDFRGRPNTGDITVDTEEDEYTLSGNPYASALDLNRVFWDSDNDEIQSFQYWDEDRTINSHYHVDNEGGYGVWVPGATDPNGTNPGTYTQPMFMNFDQAGNPTTSTGAMGADTERRFAPIGQGFMIYGDTGTGSSDIVFKNSHRRYIKEGVANNSQFRQGGSIGTELSTDYRLPHLRINAYVGESHMRQVVLAFSDDTTDGYDRGFDGRSPMDATSEVYFPLPIWETNNNKPFVISTIPFNVDKRVEIVLSLDEDDKIAIGAIEEVKFPKGVEAYVHDLEANTLQKITDNKQALYDLEAGEYHERFYIVFRTGDEARNAVPNTGSQRDVILANIDFFQNNPAQQLEIGNPEGYNITEARIYDMSGKLVINEVNLGTANRFTFNTGTISTGVYLVMLTTDDSTTVDYKIMVNNKR